MRPAESATGNPFAGLADRHRDFGDAELDRVLQAADATLRVQSLDQTEAEHRRELERLAAIADRTERAVARSRYEVDHLLLYGIRASLRDEFRERLLQVAETGELSIRGVSREVTNANREKGIVGCEVPRTIRRRG